MDGVISIRFKNGNKELIKNITSLNVFETKIFGYNGSHLCYMINTIGEPIRQYRVEDVETLMIW